MIALSTIVIFFFVLIFIYSTAAIVLTLYGWARKRRARQDRIGREKIEQINAATDRLKKRLFLIVVFQALFIIAPFLALLMIFSN